MLVFEFVYLFNGIMIWRFNNLFNVAFQLVLLIKELLLAHRFLLILKFLESWLLRNIIFVDTIQRNILIAEWRPFSIHNFRNREIILSLFFIILPSEPFFHFSFSLFLSLNSFLFLYFFFLLLFKLFLLHLIRLYGFSSYFFAIHWRCRNFRDTLLSILPWDAKSIRK